MKRAIRRLMASREMKYLGAFPAAIYLTFILGFFLPDASKTYLFIGLFALCALLVFLKERFLKTKQSPDTALLAAAVLITLALFQNSFFPVVVSLRPGGTGEVCFSDVMLNDVNSAVSGIPVLENAGWEYRGQYDNYVIYPEEEEGVLAENPLTLLFFSDTMELLFVSAPWSGSVSITTPAGSTFVDLRADEDTRLSVPITSVSCYTLLDRCVYNVGAALILAFFWSILLFALNSIHLLRRQDVLLLLMALVFIRLFPMSPSAPNSFTRLLLAVLTAAASLCLLSKKAQALLEKYKTTGKRAFVLFAALYASFASFGQRFFLDGNTRMHGSWNGLFYLLLGTLWFVPIIYLLLLGLELLASSRRSGGDPAFRRPVFWALLAILCLCQAIVLFNFWPGGYAGDNIDQIKQAIGLSGLADWHPVLHTLSFRLILAIWPHAGALVAVQMFFFALLLAKFLMLGYDAGVPLKVLAIAGAAFTFLPNQVFSGISPLKDYPYMLALLWGTYLLIRLALDAELLHKRWFLAAMPVDLFLIYGFRHNGVVPFLALLLLFAWITIRHFQKARFSLLAVSLSALLLVVAYKGPLFSALNVRPNAMSPYTTMLSAAASCVNRDLPLSQESTAILESVLPLEQWGGFYDRYRGHDPYYWGRGDLADALPFDPSHITAKEAFTVYFDALLRYPDVVIKDRLDGMDLLWDVRQPSDGFNTKAFDGVYITDDVKECFRPEFESVEENGYYYNRSPLAEMYRETLNAEENGVFDMLLWRSGAYLIFLLVLVLFWWGNRMNTLLWAAVPLLGNVAGLVLVLYHQSFRYVYAVQVITVALAFCTVLLRDRRRWAVEVPAPEEAEPLPAEAASPESSAAVYDTEPAAGLDKVAVLIPCYNECRSIGKVVDDFRRELPEAVIYVYDNNSTDGSAQIARNHGAVVRRERRQGKGNVIRRMFREIDAECYVIVDGNDTYPAESAREMVNAVLRRQADMVVGDRLSSTYFQENKRPFHNFGNDLVCKSIQVLFKSDIKDIMTGYRAFSYAFVKSFPVLSQGFEIETEMSIHAIDKNLQIENVVVAYRDRPAGSESKLNTFSDGLKVLKTIARLFQIYRPRAFFSACAAVLMALAAIFFIPILFLYSKTGEVPNLPTLIVCGFTVIAAIQSFFAGLILETINQKNRQDFELERLHIQCQYRQLLEKEDRRQDKS